MFPGARILESGVGSGALTLANSIPLLFGANIGTTVTCTIVALGFAKEPKRFRRAFTAAGISDWFNMLAVAIFLPLELLFHPLEKLSQWLTNLLYGSGGSNLGNFDPVRTATRPVVDFVKSATGHLNDTLGPLVSSIPGGRASGSRRRLDATMRSRWGRAVARRSSPSLRP